MAKRKSVAKIVEERARLFNQIGLIHADVWAFRLRPEIQDVWPTPDEMDSLRFAVCEASEALDAQLRLNETYARNHDKTLSIEKELADCAIMLLTAWGPQWRGEREVGGERHLAILGIWKEHRVESILYCCSNALSVMQGLYGHYVSPWFWVDMGLELIMKCPKIELRERVGWRLRQIEVKHLGEDDPRSTQERATTNE